jgi:hypothetical protein
MKDDKALELFQKILAKSRDHAIKWEATAEAGSYIASLSPELQLKAWPYTTYDENEGPTGPPSVTLNDGRGKQLLDITYKIDGVSPEELEEIAYLARRTALNLDDKMDDAIKKLDKLVGDSDVPF